MKLSRRHFSIFLRLLLIFILPFLLSFYLFNPFIKIDLGTGGENVSLSDAQITGANQDPLKLLIADMLQVPLNLRFYEIHVKSDIPDEARQKAATSTLMIQIRNSNQKPELDCNFKKLKERPKDVYPNMSGGPNYEIIWGKELCFLYNTNQGISWGGVFFYEYDNIESFPESKSLPVNHSIFHVYAKQSLLLFLIKYIILFFILNGIWLLILNIIKNLVLLKKCIKD